MRRKTIANIRTNVAILFLILFVSPWTLANVDYYDLDDNIREAKQAYTDGALTEAMFALERVLALQPDHFEAMAFKARVHLALNERNAAKALLEKMQQHSAYNAQEARVIALRKEAYRRGVLQGYVGYRLSYDDNLSAVPSEDQLFIPALNLNIALNNNIEEEGSRQTLYTGGSYNYKLSQRLRWLNSAYLGYSDDKAFRRYRLNAKTGLALQQGQFNYRADLALAWDKTEKTQEFFDTVLSGRVIYSISTSSALEGRLAWRYLNYAEQNSRDQSFVQLGLGYRIKFNPDWVMSVDLDHWQSIDSNRGQSILLTNRFFDQGYDHTELALGVSYQLSDEADLKLRLRYGDRDYTEADPAFLVQRNDDIWSAQMSYNYKLPSHLLLNLGVQHIDNQSNNALVDYDKTSAYLGITQLF